MNPPLSPEDVTNATIERLKRENEQLRKALIGLVGADTKEQLEGMEIAIRVMPVPDVDRMNTINAIRALMDTLPKDETHHH